MNDIIDDIIEGKIDVILRNLEFLNEYKYVDELLKAVCGYLKPECKSCSNKDDCCTFYTLKTDKKGKS